MAQVAWRPMSENVSAEAQPIPMMYRQLEYLAVEANLPAIVRDGLRAPGRATNIEATDPRATDALPWVGELRCDPLNGLRLVDYVPLFLNCRNNVMYTNLMSGRPLCIVRVREGAVNTPGTILSNGPIARDTTRFFDPFEAPSQVDLNAIRAKTWSVFGNPDSTTPTGRDERVKSAMQATLLVPDFVRAEMIEAIIVPSEASAARVRHLLRAQRITTQVPVSVDANRFFAMPRVA